MPPTYEAAVRVFHDLRADLRAAREAVGAAVTAQRTSDDLALRAIETLRVLTADAESRCGLWGAPAGLNESLEAAEAVHGACVYDDQPLHGAVGEFLRSAVTTGTLAPLERFEQELEAVDGGIRAAAAAKVS